MNIILKVLVLHSMVFVYSLWWEDCLSLARVLLAAVSISYAEDGDMSTSRVIMVRWKLINFVTYLNVLLE